MSNGSQRSTEQHFIIFLPFLRLGAECPITGVDFLPLRDAQGHVPPALASAEAPLKKILSSYIDKRGKPLDNCVVATVPGRGWDLSPDDMPLVMRAASFLFLCCWSANQYFGHGANVNATAFRTVGQSYTGTAPDRITIVTRLRDGESWAAGYRHGEVKFPMPVQCSDRELASVDEPLRAALDVAATAGSPTFTRLRSAMPFVELANTNDHLMDQNAEAILMGSAFDQLLIAGGKSSARNLGRTFGALFAEFGNTKVREARTVRPDIEINRQYAAAQSEWWVHRKWIEELYDARSQGVHRGHQSTRKWGWSLFEHLVMAAHVFPLVVKLLLQREGRYSLADRDCGSARAVDKLLAVTDWADDEERNCSLWTEIVSDCRRGVTWDRVNTKALKRLRDDGEIV
jgi:hypothetical protein